MADKSDYTPEILERAKQYKFEWKNNGDVIPTIEAFAIFIGKARSTVYKWLNEEDKKEFSDIIEELMSSQAKHLINNGLKGEYNSTITKLMLGKHGYKEATETDLTSKGEALQPVLVKFLNDDRNTQ